MMIKELLKRGGKAAIAVGKKDKLILTIEIVIAAVEATAAQVMRDLGEIEFVTGYPYNSMPVLKTL
jgi:hypothetical protein